MPRSFGKVLPSMWDEDEDFLAMSADAKYVYNFLIGQRDLGHSGIITLRVESWARRLSKSVPDVKAALKELHVEHFVVIDTEELLLLVRSLVRRDEVYKQPNTFKSAVNQIYGVRSQPLRRVLLTELERLDPAEMKGDSEAVRSDVIAWLRKTCENPPPNPSGKGSAKGYDSDPDDDVEFGQDFDVSAGEGGWVKGSVIPCENPQRVHARVDARVSPTPTTTTTPTTSAPLASVTVLPVAAPAEEAATPQREDGALFEAPPGVGAGKPRKTSTRKPAKDKPVDPEIGARKKLADDLTREWWERLDEKPSGKNAFVAARQIIYGLLEANHAPEAVAEAAKRAGLSMTIKSLEYRLQQIKEEQGRVVLPFQRRGGHTPYRNNPDQDISAGFPGASTSGGA